MKLNKIIPYLAFTTLIFIPFTTLRAQIQTASKTAEDADGDWLQNRIERPQRVYEYDEGGIRRMPQKIGSRKTAPLPCTGSPKIPVILVQFPDRSFYASGKSDAEVRHSYELFFNGKNAEEVYEQTHSHASIQQYFKDQSLGAFSPEFTILGPVTLSQSYAFYGKNEGESKDVNLYQLYKEALSKCVQEKHAEWSIFDNNGDGRIDMAFFIHAGWGENYAQDDDRNAIWARESTSLLTVTDDENNSVSFSCYGVCAEASRPVSSEYEGKGYDPKDMRMDGIGVCIHELSHALGLPDFYDTNYEAFGMDLWSVMDYGEYAGNGFYPSNYTAYERDFMGWQPLIELTDTTILNIACFAEGGQGYKVVNEANEDEYYVIENRQPKGWDTKACGKGRGLQVTHVDYNASRWTTNSVNTDKKHQRMTIIAANNKYLGTNSASTTTEWNESLKGNLFPYTQPSQSLTDTSSPAAEVYAGALMHKPIYDITQNEDGTVTIYFLKTKAEFEKEWTDALMAQDANAYMDIYDMRGIHICRCQKDELHRFSFNRGVYLVKLNDGTVRKVLLQ